MGVMPPFSGEMNDGGMQPSSFEEEPPMSQDNEQMPPMEQGSNGDYDTNFDAGVEADEDEDPKKYIQQLTGKLSQELNKYQNNNEQPDEELSKYVGNMVVRAAAKYLDDSDRKSLIKTINTINDEESNDDVNNENTDESNNEEEFSGEEKLQEMLDRFLEK